ncbi:PREDICTED: KH domain-containing protein HEN4 [Tarenaya hassleriana]|uniref:KH domain-containing protein HEN4 n=1 Tax=Tarenaya hassleriana TaxID=28532 RepID=UPI00053CA145|nr:PREDICTED: KH domain-containing protein HEN4 [Tarenaya hassleriana]
MEFSSFKWSPAESVQFRLLCPAPRTGAIIGKGGSVIRHLQSITGSRIRVIDDIPVPSEERVVLVISPAGRISADKDPKKDEHSNDSSENPNSEQRKEQRSETSGTAEHDAEEMSPAKTALVRVLERLVFGDDAAFGVRGEGDELEKSETEAFCRMLVGGNQAAFLMGRGGRMMQRIRQESGATVMVLPKDEVPPCAFPGDEVIQMSGKFSAVKKALLLVSHYLQSSNAPSTWEACPFPQHGYPPDYHSAEYHHQWDYPPNMIPEDVRPYNRMVIEEDIVFKLLCQAGKVGSVIGKGGSVVRAIQNETGALIKVADPIHDSEERVIMISARENLEQRHSPAQDAVMRVHSRISEIGFEPSAAVVARLLVQSPYIGRLLGKGGHVITEMRRATGASIRVFPKDQATKYEPQHDEIVQVVGNVKTVQDALFQITSRLREAMFPVRPSFPGMGGPPFLAPFPEVPPPFGPRPYPASPDRYHSPVGSFHERQGHHGPGFERPPSPPMSWTPQDGHAWGVADVNHGFALRNEPIGSENQTMTSMKVEIVIPQAYMGNVYGENCTNLNYIKQITGANVVVNDPKGGATEGVVVVSGTSNQTHFAQTLVHAFILSGQS